MIFVWDPEHARFDRTVFNTRGRTRAAGAAISRNCQNTRPFLPSSLSVAFRHWPVLFYDVEHPLFEPRVSVVDRVRL